MRGWPLWIGIGLGGCQPSDDPSGDALLLAVLPYTGKWEDKGILHENAVRMALEDLIDAGIQDAYGGRFKVLTVNSGDGADVVESAVRDIITGPDGDKVLGIVSSTGDAHEGSAKVAVEYGVPHFEGSNGASDAEFLDWTAWSTDELGYLLSARALCTFEAQYTAQYILDQFPTGRIAFVRGDEIHDKMHTAVVRATLAAAGFQGTLIESHDPALAGEADPGNAQDYQVSYDDLDAGGVETQLHDLVTAESPDVLFFHVRGDAPNLRMLQDADRAGFEGRIATCGMARTTGLLDPNENGLISDYLVGHDASNPTDRFHFLMRGAIPSDRLDAFKAEYESRYGMAADTFTPGVYDATMAWALGVLAAGDKDRAHVLGGIVDVSRGGALGSRDDAKALVEAVASGQDVDYDGASGPMDVRDDRTVPGYYYVERVIANGDGTFGYEKLPDPAPVVF
ncbi:MAG: ABC transporter substrate-binding protein [Myxococcota bacterium]